MLSLMRKNAGSWIIKIILGIIVIVFVSWGMGSYGEMRRNRAATVGKHTITLKDFDATYRSMLQQTQLNARAMGSELTEEALEGMQLEKQALAQLINRVVLLQAANKMHLTVGDEELRNSIYSMPAFHNNEGQFDASIYKARLDSQQLNNEAFEDNQRQDLLIGKVMEVVMGAVKVSDAEVAEWYQHINRRVAAKYVELNPAQFEVTVSDAEIETYYNSHRELYMSQPMRQITYVRFAPADFADEIDVSEETLQDIYDSNINLYSTPALLDLSQIVVAIENPGNEDSEAEAKARIEEASAKLKDGADFTEMVKAYSAEVMQLNDGRAVDIPREDFVAYFGEELANTPVGEITPPVKTDFGWYLFKFNGVKPSEVRAFAEVKDLLKEDLRLNQARNLAYDVAEEVSAAAFAGEDLAATADARDLQAVITEYFDHATPVSGLNLYQPANFNDFVFTYEIGDVSQPYEIEGDYYVVSILDEKPTALIPLTDVQVVVEQAVRADKQSAAAMDSARQIIAAIKDGQTIEEAAASFGTVQSTGLITRYDYVMDFAMPGSVAQEGLFSLSPSNPVINEPLPGPMVMVYEDSALADAENYETESAGIRMELLQLKRDAVFDLYLQKQKQQTKIWVADYFTQFYEVGM